MDRLQFGWARREISTNDPVSIRGQVHLRISQGILDPLFLTALVIDGGAGQDSVIFLSCDVCVIPWDMAEEIGAAAAALRPEIRPEWVVLNATHTHASLTLGETPATSPDGKPIFSGKESYKFVVQQAVDAIVEAWDSRSEGGFAYGYGYAVVAHSRRVCYFHDQSLKSNSVAPNGHCIMYGNTNDADFSHYEGSGDHFLNAMYTFDGDGKLTGIVINVPCPSQNSEQLNVLSADYWHDVRQLVKEAFGEDVFVLPQCAPAGDLAPRILHYLDAQARRMGLKYDMPYDAELAKKRVMPDDNTKRFAERKDIAERIVAAVKEIYGWAKKEIITEAPLRHRVWSQPMRRRMITEEELATCEEKLRQLESAIPEQGEDPERYRRAMSTYNSVKQRNKTVTERYKRQNEIPKPACKVHAIALGDIAFATNKFELYQDFMHRVQARSPFTQTFAIQLAGDGGGTYLATQRSQENKGYGASLFCNWIGYEGGQDWVEGVLKNLNEMKEETET